MTYIWNAKAAAKITKGIYFSNWHAKNLVFDSRLIEPEDLFIALPGAARDGHEFVNDAFKKGAAAAIVSSEEKVLNEFRDRLLIVSSVTKALDDLANFKISSNKAFLVAVTGSIGKTSTKEILNYCLSVYKPCFASRANYNNMLGFKLNLASLPDNIDYAIIEMGMNHSGEITPMTQILKPDIAIITAIESVHQANFNSIDDIALAKSEIMAGLKPQGSLFYNGLSNSKEVILAAAKNYNINNLIDFSSNVKIHSYQIEQLKTIAKIEVLNKKYLLIIDSIIAEHQVQNILIVLSLVAYLGFPLEPAIEKLKYFKLPRGRGQLTKILDNVSLIDDSYNSSPKALKAALKNLKSFPGRKIAVIGDMLKELGPNSREIYLSLKSDIMNNDIAILFTIGSEIIQLHDALAGEKIKLKHFDNLISLEVELRNIMAPGDTVLIKGANATKLLTLCDNLRKNNAL